MVYIISILPIIIYFLTIRGMDGFSLSKWGRIAECFGCGVLACCICIGISRILEWSLFPIVEEAIKAISLAVMIHRKRSTFFLEVLTYGAAIGAGFATMENILYASYQDLTVGDAFLRGVGTSLLHIGCTALYASLALVFFRLTKGRRKALRRTVTALCLIPSAAIHCLYNLFLLPEVIQMVLAVAVFILMFYSIYTADAKMIHRWLDMCIANDIVLYKSIREGRLAGTNAGEYLIGLKSKFSPETFFDICVFLGLYLELTIAAKSRMILKEAGMDAPLDEETCRINSEKVAELKALRKSIGKAAVTLLRPLVTIRDTDVWTMQQLLCK